MARPKATLELSERERTELQAPARRRKSAQAAALRACIVLLCAEGSENHAVAERLGVTKQTVSKWRGRFVRDLTAPLFMLDTDTCIFPMRGASPTPAAKVKSVPLQQLACPLPPYQ